jgi:ribonuclease E
MVLTMTRDSKEDATIGNDIEFVEMMDEDDLLTYETEYTDKEGKVHPVICHEPFDYDAIFPDMTEKQLRAVAGGREPEAGSRDSNRRELGGNDDAWDDEPKRGSRTASRRGSRDDQDDDAPAPRRGARAERDDDAPAPRRSARAAPQQDDDAQDDAPAPRSRRRAADTQDDDQDAAPAPRRAARGRAEPAPDPEGIDPETGAPWDDADSQADAAPAEEAPSQRRAPRTAARGAAKEEADDAPQRPASSVAARRASLRRA